MTRRRLLALISGSFVVVLLVAGLAASFTDWGGSYQISPETADVAAPGPSSAPAPEERRLRIDDAALLASGKTLYATHCASCHGVALEGQPNWKTRKSDGRMPAPPHDETGHTWHHPDRLLFAITKVGTERLTGLPSDMPAYSEILPDRDIIAVLSYIKSTWPAEIRERHDQINLRDRQVGSGASDR